MRHFNTNATTQGQAHVTVEVKEGWITAHMVQFDHHGEIIQQFERTFSADVTDADIVAHLVTEANAG